MATPLGAALKGDKVDMKLTNEDVNNILLFVGLFAALGVGVFAGAAWVLQKLFGKKE